MPTLKMMNITKKFPGVLALNNVNLHVNKGEVVGLVGENGAGKSTLMKILSGVYPHGTYEGEIKIDDKAYCVNSPLQAEQHNIAMIYQEVSLHPDLSIAENLLLGKWAEKSMFVNWKLINEKAEKILKRIKLDLDPTEKTRNTSISQQQLIAIGRALNRNPKILIMDEPTSSLTENETNTLFDIVRELKQQGIGIILISHKISEIMQQTDRVVVMRDGCVVEENDTSKITPDIIVEKTVGRRIENLYPEKTNNPGDVLMSVKDFTVQHPINKNKCILSNINFELKKGEVLGLAGLVGAGRSELMNAIFGLGGTLSGEIILNGKRVKIQNPKQAINNGLALITEDRKHDGFVGVLNIKDNIVMASYKKISRLGWMNKKNEYSFAKESFDKLKVKAPSMSVLLNTLSGGNQQKIVLSKWLMTQPNILLLDDPTRGVDVGTKNELYKMIDLLSFNGVSCIVASSEMPELMAMCNRILVLGNGGLIKELNKNEFDEKMIMKYAMC